MENYNQILTRISLANTYDELMKIKFSHLDGDAYDCIQYLHDGMRKKIGIKGMITEEKIYF